MPRIPIKGDPPTMQEIVATYGSPLDKIVEIHADCQRRLAEAEAAGAADDARELRKLLKRTRTTMDEYGIEPKDC